MPKSYEERKAAWAEKMKAKQAASPSLSTRSSDRLPPGQHLTTGFPVLDLGIKPKIPTSDWSLALTGQVEYETTLDWPSLNALPQTNDTSDFHCVTTWSKFDCEWSGVAFTDLLDLVKPTADATHALYTAYDGYTTNTPLEILYDSDVLLATAFEGKPITTDHGGPARTIIPKLYAWKGTKFVKKIEFLTSDQLGYWEKRGYSNTADPWLEDRFS
ncbi:MAG: DMSO/TMAO reductase YedYZ molybdopterin-dependent catalytic subunit [Verrucomicrobiales bacterium]|jgi:DMSO/TMAO reductase YedYZ molybdopterin-dependent catalytic subunit